MKTRRPARPAAQVPSSRKGLLTLRQGSRPPVGDPVAVVPAEGAGGVLGERVAIALPVRGAQEGSDDLEAPVVNPACLAPEVGEPEVDVQLEKLDSRRSLRHAEDRTLEIGRSMGTIRFGPARVPSRESPEAAVELLLERGHSACEIDFEAGFW